MPQRLKKTRTHRALKAKKLGAKTKHFKENKGTTAAFPLTGAIPSLRGGRPVEPSTIIVPPTK
jgi:hypothetical protein